jgi:hypothetical protein
MQQQHGKNIAHMCAKKDIEEKVLDWFVILVGIVSNVERILFQIKQEHCIVVKNVQLKVQGSQEQNF